MPRGDKTGPRGMGPLTGRAAGFCAGNDRPGYAGDDTLGRGRGGQGRGFGRGRGMGQGGGYGRGRGGRFAGSADFAKPAVDNPLAEELARLRAQITALENRISGSGKDD